MNKMIKVLSLTLVLGVVLILGACSSSPWRGHYGRGCGTDMKHGNDGSYRQELQCFYNHYNGNGHFQYGGR